MVTFEAVYMAYSYGQISFEGLCVVLGDFKRHMDSSKEII